MGMDIGIGGQKPGDQVSGPGGVPGVSKPATTSDTAPTSASSIQASEMQAAALAILAANIPSLDPPSASGVDSAALGSARATAINVATSVQETEKDISDSMWGNYAAMLAQLAEEYRASQKQAELHPELSASSMARVELQQWVTDPGAVSMAGVLAGGIADAQALVGAVDSSTGVDRISVSPFADAIAGVGGPLSGMPMDIQAAAALVAALLNGQAVNKVNAEMLTEALGQKPPVPPEDIDFAVKYGNQVLGMVIPQMEGASSLPPERAALNTAVRLTLSAMALNLLYRTLYGGMNGMEMKELLNADPSQLGSLLKFPENTSDEMRAKITTLMSNLLTQVQACFPKDAAGKESVIDNISNYVGQKDSVSSMLAVTQMFRVYLSETDKNSNIQA